MKNYIKKYLTKEWLFSNGFKYNRFFSTDKEAIYSQRFVIIRYFGIPMIECEILIYYPDGNVKVNVYKPVDKLFGNVNASSFMDVVMPPSVSYVKVSYNVDVFVF